jgi:hypothetical protein
MAVSNVASVYLGGGVVCACLLWQRFHHELFPFVVLFQRLVNQSFFIRTVLSIAPEAIAFQPGLFLVCPERKIVRR